MISEIFLIFFVFLYTLHMHKNFFWILMVSIFFVGCSDAPSVENMSDSELEKEEIHEQALSPLPPTAYSDESPKNGVDTPDKSPPNADKKTPSHTQDKTADSTIKNTEDFPNIEKEQSEDGADEIVVEGEDSALFLTDDASKTGVDLSDLQQKDERYTRADGAWYTGKIVSYHSKTGHKAQEGYFYEGMREGEWSFWDENGRLWANGFYKSGKPHGQWLRWHPNGEKQEMGVFEFGKRVGTWNFFADNGYQTSEKSYQNGKPHGRWSLWYSNGTKKETMTFENGVLDGTREQWYSDGKHKAFSEYINGRKTGKSTQWYSNGHKKNAGNYVADLRDGEWSFWDDSGQLLTRRSYVRGVLQEDDSSRDAPPSLASDVAITDPQPMPTECAHTYAPVCGRDAQTYVNACEAQRAGVEVWYRCACRPGTMVNESLLPETEYQIIDDVTTVMCPTSSVSGGDSRVAPSPPSQVVEGTPYKSYYTNGEIQEEGVYVNGQKEGAWTTWYPDGQKRSEDFYQSGFRNGDHFFWYKNGNMMEQGKYKREVKNGYWKQWHMNGNLHVEGMFDNGSPVGIWRYYRTNGTIEREKTY